MLGLSSQKRSEDSNEIIGFRDVANQRLFEVYSAHGSSERHDNAPYGIHKNPDQQWEAEKGVFFQDVIAAGYKFGITSDGDDHSGKPGSKSGGGKSYPRKGLTAVYAD